MTLHHRQSCYEWVGKPASEQWSNAPNETDPAVQHFAFHAHQSLTTFKPATEQQRMLGFGFYGQAFKELPLDACGITQCHLRGYCVKMYKENKDGTHSPQDHGAPHCMCMKGYQGHTCGEPMLGLCPGECQGRGTCNRGFCHCKPPYWGLGCGRERAWAPVPGASLIPNRIKLRIYVYDLPANVAFPLSFNDGIHDMGVDTYETDKRFLERLLRDPEVRTENPEEANLFYMHPFSYSYSSNTNPPTNQIMHVVNYVAQNYPYYNRSGGRDHFLWATGDRGVCYVPQNISKVMYVTLFGLHAFMYDGDNATFLRPLPTRHAAHGCFDPRKDIMAPPWYDNKLGLSNAPAVYEELVANNGSDPGRDILFFFAGTVRLHDTAGIYSGGVRQALAIHLSALKNSSANTSDVLFSDGHVANYETLHKRSKFCIAPHGGGFGTRLTEAMATGCVPVIIQDQVYQPYEADGVLPYDEFSLRLGKADIPLIVPMLRAVSEERLRRLRLNMAKYYGAFLWNESNGGKAYEYMIAALEQRLHRIWGRLWGDSRRHRNARALRGLGH
ncbi:hypothetical protein HYH03_008323 [Edaphochlamys debaryana]|uniref:EGF-like domain-containing protein n=1 Tax=Edaphochlamys debaryana TaxID=47281 RepID=A0A835Y1H6_9CHLO|nr:hypothetical protein HYH03_008323 [Edaphochlamys debaryana]|eukprot:KAG2493507.1 hypothetical protein HYH03_008323 [Edaphochlamys debaryana]